METLSVVICGADKRAMQSIAQALSDDGARVETHHPMNLLLSKTQGGDFFLIDLDGLNSYVLCSLLLIVRYTFPTVPVIGISTRSSERLLGNDFKLDACFKNIPCLEDLIVLAPSVAANYRCDTDTLREIATSPRTLRNLRPNLLQATAAAEVSLV